MYGFPSVGNLVYQYNPFQNLQNPNPTEAKPAALIGLSMESYNAGINITEPITLETEVSYDDSINLIVSDETNPLKIVNSRFYQTSTMTYEIADRKGNLDTNIYSEENFKVEAGFVKSVRTITDIEFLGIKDGGIMKVGNYTFYFRLADADGNESDFIAESGKVVCHIGTVNTPKSIRGGQLDEISYKLINFKLNNLDLAYDYINIYYTRSTGDGDQEIVKTYRITDKFKITNNDVEISITGYENHVEISIDDINVQYASFDSAKTLANCQNLTFVGNTTNDYDLFKTLEKYSLLITPQIRYDNKGIGNLSPSYDESYLDIGHEYYNAKNIYYKLSYWDEEIYRLGIVYILNNYTLSPVFNIRGKKVLTGTEVFEDFKISDKINYGEDYIIENSDINNPENSKGVFKIDLTDKSMFNNNASIKPIGIQFNFGGNVVTGDGKFIDGLQDLTKGFFIVRQKRIPTILAQSVGIATSNKANIPVIMGVKTASTSNIALSYKYFAESFLRMKDSYPILKPSLFPISDITNNALLCPEADVRRTLFNTFFNSSEYSLRQSKYKSTTNAFINYEASKNSFALKSLTANSNPQTTVLSELTLIEPGIELIRNNMYDFSSKSGDAIIAYKHSDPLLGNYEDVETSSSDWNTTATKVRGEFNTFIGTNIGNLVHGTYYNIFQRDYNFDEWKNYFLIRYNDSSPFLPISNRTSWNKLTLETPTDNGSVYSSDTFFRGDCYINTFTHRMHWNFIDPEMPTNKRIVDPYTWAKNFKIVQKATTMVSDAGTITTPTILTYNKLLLIFTYKDFYEPDAWTDAGIPITDPGLTHEIASGLLEPDAKKFKKYSERNGLFGAEKINKPDVNAVPLGHWVTFKICSNVNLGLRDIDFSRPMEEAIHRQKRGFYPLYPMDPNNALPESDIINNGISKSLGDKYYFEIPDVPFLKTNFATRIYYSNLLQNSTFTNGNRIFEAQNYLDYTREYGALVKIIEWYGRLIAIMEHGILMIPVNERAMMKNESGENVYINTATVLPQNPTVLSNTFGSLWPESVVKTSRFIYGIDTVGKKIWRTDGEKVEMISDLKVQKFLNDNIILRESDKDRSVNINFIKAHYNAFKYDILFTFKYDDKQWNLCWNELLGKWTTQYTWFPEFSENINNIFYTFANQSKHTLAENKLYKHGFAGTLEEAGNILPTNWYGEQHPFEYEFIVSSIPGVQKIFNDLMIVSNSTEPDSFFYEIIGDGYDWAKQKTLIMNLNNTTLISVDGVSMAGIDTAHTDQNVKLRYERYLIGKSNVKKIPYIFSDSFDVNDSNSFYGFRNPVAEPFNMSELRDLSIRENNKTKEKMISVYQKGADIKQYGRRKGNMQYLEDSWNVQIQPISYPYAYLAGGTLELTNPLEIKIRDNYVKLRVKYTGTQYAIVNALRTLFTISHA